MKISYHKDTDSLYIHFNSNASHDVMVINNDMNIDMDEHGHPTGIEIHQHASEYIDMKNMELHSLPIQDFAIAAQGRFDHRPVIE